MIAILEHALATNLAAFMLLIVACALLLVAAVWLSAIDIREHLLPNRIVYPSAILAVVLLSAVSLLLGDGGVIVRTLLSGALLCLGYLTVRFISPRAMGLGDVKLAFVLGLYLGFVSWWHLFYGTVFAFVLGGAVALALVLVRRANGKTAIPFGPFMLAGALIALLCA